MDLSSYAIVVFIIGAFLAFRAWRSGDAFGERRDEDDARVILPPPRQRARHDDMGHAGFAAIRHADPRFDLDSFYARVSEMFLAFHAAAASGDLTPARRFVDERYYADLCGQIASAPVPPVPGAPLRVLSARAMTASHEAGMDTVRVLIGAAQGDDEAPSFREYWTLIRRQGALTKADLSLYKCPNCGAPTDGDDPTRCAYCHARLADPALDWVVSQIRAD